MNNKGFKNIEFVVRKNLCTGCGACAGVCRRNAIDMRINALGVYAPALNRTLCNNCGLCASVCPGHGFDYRGYHMKINGALPENVSLGHCLSSYAGYCADPDVLKTSQSGGFVSTLLLYCMEKGMISGAVVTKRRKDNPFETSTFIAQNRKDILAAAGSIYNPVPASMIINTILETEGTFAFVGTPCQIQGMRKAESALPELAGKIKLYIGLHCLGVFNWYFYDYILYKLRLDRRKIAYFRHRDKYWRGWPCDLHIKDFQGSHYNMDYKKSRLVPRPYFTPWRCLLCFDKANEFSDVSCGDCRIPGEHAYFKNKGYDVKNGLTEFVVRTPRAEEILSSFLKDGKFIVHRIDKDSLIKSTGVVEKKSGVNTFRKIAFLFNGSAPEYGVGFFPAGKPEHSFISGIKKILTPVASIHYYILYLLMRYSVVRWLLERTSYGTYRILNSLRNSLVEWKKYRGLLLAVFEKTENTRR